MTRFIKLTRWSSGDLFNGDPVYVDPERIVWMWESTRTICRTDEHRKTIVADRPRERVTWIDFGNSGEDNGLQVQESPAQIMEKINETRR